MKKMFALLAAILVTNLALAQQEPSNEEVVANKKVVDAQKALDAAQAEKTALVKKIADDKSKTAADKKQAADTANKDATASQAAAAAASVPANTPAKAADFASDNDSLVGDHLFLRAEAYGFMPVSADLTDKTARCAPDGARYIVNKDNVIYFYLVPVTKAAPSSDNCPSDAKWVKEGSQYTIDSDHAKNMRFKRTGVAFGTLIVPFKFRLGEDKKLVSSSTIAPYIGARWAPLQGYGMDLMLVGSAGLGLVPVYDDAKKTNETKAAFSTAVGFTLTSSKNADFSAGLLIGKDFLNKADREIDPSVNKMWISLWLGLSR